MTLRTFEDPVNASTPLDLMQTISTNTDGLFGFILILTIFTISFLGVRTNEVKERFTAGSFFALIAAVFLTTMGLLNAIYITVLATITVVSLGLLFYKKQG